MLQKKDENGVDPTFLRSAFLAIGASILNFKLKKVSDKKEELPHTFNVFTMTFVGTTVLDTLITTGKPATYYGSFFGLAAVGVKMILDEKKLYNQKLEELNEKLDRMENKLKEKPKEVNVEETLEMIKRIRADDCFKNRNKIG